MFVGTSFSSPVMPRTSAPQKVAEPVAQDQVSAGVALDKAPSFKDILALVGTTAERATVGDRVAAAELRFLGGINTPSEAVDLSGSATERGDDIVGG